MKKLNIIFLILCISILQQVTARKHRLPPNYYERFRINYTEHNRNYTQEIDYETPNGYKTYILSKNDSHIFVNSTDQNFTSCVMSFKNLSYGFQASLLYNKTIVLWDLQTESFNAVGVTLLLINPQDCNYKSLDVPADVIPKDHSPYKPQVLTYSSKDHFDIFYGGQQACMPCRFTGQGEKIKMEHQITDIMTSRIARPYLIRRYREKGLNISYLLIYSFYNESLRTAVNKLDDNFNVVENKFVDHPIDAVAIGQHGIEVCYKLEYQRNIQETDVYCDHYLTDFRRVRHTQLDIPRYEYVNEIAIRVNSLGSLCVAVPHISYENQGNKYSLTFFQYVNWDSKNRYGPSFHIENDVDDESGYHLKTRTSKSLRQYCG